MPSPEFKRPIAFVTGAAGGIGQSVARRLVRDGFRIAVGDRDEAALAALSELLRRESPDAEVLAIPVDGANEISVGRFAELALDRFGAPDVLITLVGIQGRTAALWQLEPAEWRELFEVNVNSVHLLCRAVLPGMIEAGRGIVILMSSQRGKDGVAGLSHYAGSKGAIIVIGRSLAKELAPLGLVVHTVTPGPIAAGMGSGSAPSPEIVAKLNIPMGRFGTADEVAELVSILSSGRLSFSTGYTWDVSGGKAVS